MKCVSCKKEISENEAHPESLKTNYPQCVECWKKTHCSLCSGIIRKGDIVCIKTPLVCLRCCITDR